MEWRKLGDFMQNSASQRKNSKFHLLYYLFLHIIPTQHSPNPCICFAWCIIRQIVENKFHANMSTLYLLYNKLTSARRGQLYKDRLSRPIHPTVSYRRSLNLLISLHGLLAFIDLGLARPRGRAAWSRGRSGVAVQLLWDNFPMGKGGNVWKFSVLERSCSLTSCRSLAILFVCGHIEADEEEQVRADYPHPGEGCEFFACTGIVMREPAEVGRSKILPRRIVDETSSLLAMVYYIQVERWTVGGFAV